MICIHSPFFKEPLTLIYQISNFPTAQMAVHSTGPTISELYMEQYDWLKIIITYYCL